MVWRGALGTAALRSPGTPRCVHRGPPRCVHRGPPRCVHRGLPRCVHWGPPRCAFAVWSAARASARLGDERIERRAAERGGVEGVGLVDDEHLAAAQLEQARRLLLRLAHVRAEQVARRAQLDRAVRQQAEALEDPPVCTPRRQTGWPRIGAVAAAAAGSGSWVGLSWWGLGAHGGRRGLSRRTRGRTYLRDDRLSGAGRAEEEPVERHEQRLLSAQLSRVVGARERHQLPHRALDHAEPYHRVELVERRPQSRHARRQWRRPQHVLDGQRRVGATRAQKRAVVRPLEGGAHVARVAKALRRGRGAPRCGHLFSRGG
eukprot:6431378-Prymnesium_polylepis.1